MVIRISDPARNDLAEILAISSERWGEVGEARYRRQLLAAMRAIARTPRGPSTRDRSDLIEGARSFHIRLVRGQVKDPVHVIYYLVTSERIEVLRILHDRMDPASHFAPKPKRR